MPNVQKCLIEPYANLQGADLQGANLQGADLQEANLREANLREANLRGADLQGAYLQGAKLRGADLQGAELQGAKNIPPVAVASLCITPEGELRVYKKCQEGIVTLLIPQDAQRSNATGRKCRGEYAIVVATPKNKPAHSKYDSSFLYTKGKRVRPDHWDTDRWNECGGGIHFFLTKEEAKAY